MVLLETLRISPVGRVSRRGSCSHKERVFVVGKAHESSASTKSNVLGYVSVVLVSVCFQCRIPFYTHCSGLFFFFKK